MTETLFGVSGAARRLGAKPADITHLFYLRELRDDICPIVSGKRIIPESYLPVIRAALVRRGRHLDSPAPATAL